MKNQKQRPNPGARRRFRTSWERMESRQLLATLPILVTNAEDSGPGSLREAINQANNQSGADNILFEIPASTAPNLDVPFPGFDPISQSWRIKLQSELPAITDQLTIDGFSQGHFPVPYRYPAQVSPTLLDPVLISSTPNDAVAVKGNNAVNRVIIDGSQTGGSTGFEIEASHTIIRGLIIDGFGIGIAVPSPDNVGVLIQGNYIGDYFQFNVNSNDGTPLTGNRQVTASGQGNSLQGILLGSTNSTVGGVATRDANVITGNGLQGISILNGAQGNQILGNQIGIAGPTINNRFFINGNGSEGILIGDSTTKFGDPSIPVGASDVSMEASSNLIGGSSTNAGNLISANCGDGIRIFGPLSTRNIVKGNSIGNAPGGGFPIEPGGGLVFGSGDTGNLGDGVRIENSGTNLIGGVADTDRNFISANEGAGVRILGTNATGNVVRNNIIGLTSDGLSPLGNSMEGVTIASSGNIVGPGNIISANLRGVWLTGGGAFSNTIQDNLIGTDINGVADLGNAREGIRIENSSKNEILGNSRGSQVISGNNVGILIFGTAATNNEVLGNLIGSDRSGMFDLGNSLEGIRVENAPYNTIGGVTTFDRNLISANHWGVAIVGPLASFNSVEGNFIGSDITGAAPLGNEVDGVIINQGASNNAVGGPSIPPGNTIAFNIRDGVRIEDLSVRNSILTNSIFSNGALGIDLVDMSDPANGLTPNDINKPGPNFFQNYPVLSSVATSLTFTNIQGSLDSTPNTTFVIQFFANSKPDAFIINSKTVYFGEGEIYLGQTTVTTGANGHVIFSVNVPVTVGSGQGVTATATDSSNNTSEFSEDQFEEISLVQFQMANFVVDEAAGTTTITVVRSGGSGGQFSVDYSTSNGTAIAGSDYQATSGTLTFEIGQNTASFTIPIIDDTIPEADETVLLTLSNPVGAAMLGNPSMAVLTIQDNDQPGAFRFLNSAYFVNEADGTATITVVRDSGGGTVSVNYATANGTAQAGSDYLPVFGTLVFGPGETVKTFSVPIVLNPAIEGNETVILNLGSPTGGATLGSPSSSVLVILDDRVDRMGPVVVGVRAIAGAVGVSSVLITYSEPLDSNRATDLLNYGFSIRIAGRDGRLGTRDDQLIGIQSATYDPASMTVRLALGRLLAKKMPVQVEINQVTSVAGVNRGVADLAGNLLNSVGVGNPGIPYKTQVVARPAPSVVIQTGVKTPAPRSNKAKKAKPVVHPAHPKVITSHPASAKGKSQAQAISLPSERNRSNHS
ncbi:Calx-beta domain-containing protein [Tundrisphaera lichenicola]|uniref:beta strand repeat-containing protein n=1 Tax=Tundrisphaera lichenicola TaxID=2029860 RepID=UPI003EBF4A62